MTSCVIRYVFFLSISAFTAVFCYVFFCFMVYILKIYVYALSDRGNSCKRCFLCCQKPSFRQMMITL